jgi:hypothetical protein
LRGKGRGESRFGGSRLAGRGLVIVIGSRVGGRSLFLCRFCRRAAATIQIVGKDILKVMHGLLSRGMLLNPAGETNKK